MARVIVVCPICDGEGSYLIPEDLHRSAGPRKKCFKCDGKGTIEVDALEAGLDT